MLSREAQTALVELDQGARFNVLSVVSRELIAAGLAFDGWGYLEITEAGRRAARQRHYRNFAIADEQIHDMAAQIIADVDRARSPDVPLCEKEIISHRGETENTDPAADQVDRNRPTLQPAIEMAGVPWSRERAIKAAGVANGVVGIWVDQRWIQAFMLAYEDTQ